MTDPVAVLRDLVGFKSISKTSNEDIVAYLESFFSDLGFATYRIESKNEPKRANLLCSIGPDGPDGLMLSGHMDVVPVKGQDWHSDPFVLRQDGDMLFGRGTADMKGFIAATCVALKKLSGQSFKKTLSLLWTYDEEIGCLGSAQAAPMLTDYLSHMPKTAWIGEPTNFVIQRMHAGHVTVKIAAKGKGAHSSDPALGISAIKALNQALVGIFALEEDLKAKTSLPEFFKRPFVILNVGEIHGGTAVNIIPDEAYALIGFRPLPHSSIDDIFAQIVAAAQHSHHSPAQLSFTIEKITPPMFCRENTPLEKLLQDFANPEGPKAAQFATDAGNLTKAGMECLIFGPGTIDVAHQANEWIKRSDLYLACDKIENIIKRWCL